MVCFLSSPRCFALLSRRVGWIHPRRPGAFDASQPGRLLLFKKPASHLFAGCAAMFRAGLDLLEAPSMHEPDYVACRVGYSSLPADQLLDIGRSPTGDALLGNVGPLDYASDHHLLPP